MLEKLTKAGGDEFNDSGKLRVVSLAPASVEKNSHKSRTPLLFNSDRSSCRYLDGHSVRKEKIEIRGKILETVLRPGLIKLQFENPP